MTPKNHFDSWGKRVAKGILSISLLGNPANAHNPENVIHTQKTDIIFNAGTRDRLSEAGLTFEKNSSGEISFCYKGSCERLETEHLQNDEVDTLVFRIIDNTLVLCRGERKKESQELEINDVKMFDNRVENFPFFQVPPFSPLFEKCFSKEMS